jgi:hypothetical protein
MTAGPPSGADIARDFFVATTDRRSELAGLKWDMLRRGPEPGAARAPRPPQAAPPGFASFTGGERLHEPFTATAYHLPRVAPARAPGGLSPGETLALILRYAAMPLRWEPLNQLSQHRGAGSAAASFPIDTYVIAPQPGGPALRCSPLDFALLDEGRPPPGPLADTGDALTLILVGCHDVCARDYGALSASLLALEAGMIAGQIGLLAALLGWRAGAMAVPDWRPCREALGLDHWSDMPMVRLRLAGDGASVAVSSLDVSRIRTLKPVARHASAEAFPRLRALIERALHPGCGAAGTAGADVATEAFPAWAADRGLLAAFASRSSGPGGAAAGWPGIWDGAMRDALLADLAILDAVAAATRPAVPLFLSLCGRTAAADPLRAYQVDLPASSLSPGPAGPLEGSVPPDSFCTFTIGVDDKAALDRQGAFGFTAAHVAAGSLAQCICLAAALHGLTARPLRSYSDKHASALLPVAARALLQIQIERPRRANIAYHLV